jgi:hypothetical protein
MPQLSTAQGSPLLSSHSMRRSRQTLLAVAILLAVLIAVACYWLPRLSWMH